VFRVVHLAGDEADQAFELFQGGDMGSSFLQPCKFVADHALLGIEQGFTNQEMCLMHTWSYA
jgi:hypothetical protein